MNLNRTDIVIDDDLSEGEASTPEETQLPSASQTYYPVKRIVSKYLLYTLKQQSRVSAVYRRDLFDADDSSRYFYRLTYF